MSTRLRWGEDLELQPLNDFTYFEALNAFSSYHTLFIFRIMKPSAMEVCEMKTHCETSKRNRVCLIKNIIFSSFRGNEHRVFKMDFKAPKRVSVFLWCNINQIQSSHAPWNKVNEWMCVPSLWPRGEQWTQLFAFSTMKNCLFNALALAFPGTSCWINLVFFSREET